MKTVVLLPTIYRPGGLMGVLSSLGSSNVDVIVAAEFDDLAAYDFCQKYQVELVYCKKEKAGPNNAWNEALKSAPDYDLYVLGSDDVVFHEGWLDEALKVLEETNAGLVAFNDGTGKVERAGFATQYMMTRDFIIDHNGGLAAYPYPCDFSDVEASLRAKRAGLFAYAPKAMVLHHWRRVDDEAYRRADSRRKESRELFEKRKAAGFPDDVEPILVRERV